jgi:hypothetical protein
VIECLHRVFEVLGPKVGIPRRHPDIAVPENGGDGPERDARHRQRRRGIVPEIVED